MRLNHWLRLTSRLPDRVEDTDQARSTKESEAAVLRDLAWLGISYDEGEPAAPPTRPVARL